MFLVRQKDRFHQNQQVFWPRLCPHCDRVVNVMKQQSRELDADAPNKPIQRRRKSRRLVSEPSMKKKQVNLSKRLKLHKRTVQTSKLASKQSRVRSVSHVDRHCERGVPITCGFT